MESNTLGNRMKQKQPHLHQQFSRVFKHKKISHAYIIEGNHTLEQYEFGQWLAQGVFCDKTTADPFPCGTCLTCQRIEQNEYSDITTIEPNGQSIKVEQIRDIKNFFTKSGIESRQKVLIIKEAEKMTISAANSLLKFIEEPDGDMHVLLLTETSRSLLPTIQSRCQLITLKLPSFNYLSQSLAEKGISESDCLLLLHLTHSVEEAVELYEDEWFNRSREIIEKWLIYLDKKDPLAFIYVQQYLVKQGKEKEQQFFLMDMLMVMCQIKLRKEGATSREQEHYMGFMEAIIQARVKLKANVSFQNTCEQFVWRLLEID